MKTYRSLFIQRLHFCMQMQLVIFLAFLIFAHYKLKNKMKLFSIKKFRNG